MRVPSGAISGPQQARTSFNIPRRLVPRTHRLQPLAWKSALMAKAILTTKIDPTYDDLPEQRYHFPRTYLRQVEAARGDWIVYYEPRRPSGDLMKSGGKQAYFATARISDIIDGAEMISAPRARSHSSPKKSSSSRLNSTVR